MLSLAQKYLGKFPDANNNQLTALFIAMVVRNAMEEFHGKYLSDTQMAELNPIIRNAIYTALFAIDRRHSDQRAREYISHHYKMIPSYWELPKLIDEFADDNPSAQD
jgi:hypothetical protein